MGKMDGRVAIVAGASRGTGKAIALAFASEGARVAVVARTERERGVPGTIGATAGEIQANGGTAIAIRCDVSAEADVDAMMNAALRDLGPVDILVNSTAYLNHDPLLETTSEIWSTACDVNVKGAFLLTKAVLPGMIARKRGSIIHLTGRAAIDPSVGGPATSATKAALEHFVRVVALEMKPHGIAINCLDPGGVKSERRVALSPPDFDWSRAKLPSEIAPFAVDLACQPADLTGRIVVCQPKYATR